ncbi:MAG: hypothetical protein EON60_01525 [Alphaproteobacteria bacterium]|nr:MAG: hypothetical protein EON60_01525 [Alphaproteobacteria bacterium]
MKHMMFGASTLALVAGIANAQDAERTGRAVMATEVLPVSERMATDHAPIGIRAGSFLVIPRVELIETFNDNIYATSEDEESDLITSIRPEVAVRSNWNRHAVNAVAKADIRRYADNKDEDHENFLVAADGRVDILRNTSVGGGVSYAQDHEDRGDPNTIGTPEEPTRFNTTIARIGAYRGVGKANARVDSEVKKLDYEDGTTAAGTNIDNDVRDRTEYTQSLRLGYQLTRQFEVFGRGAWDNRVYDNKDVARSNNGQTYTVGTSFDISGKTKGEVYGGYMSRSFANNNRDSISDPTFGGKLTWNATDLTSVIGSVNRGIEETTLGTSSGFVSTDYDLGVEHALTRDVMLKSNIGYTNNKYEGAGAQREDDILVAGAGVDYWLNRCLKAGLSYNFSDRDSNAVDGDFSRNTVMLRLTATY